MHRPIKYSWFISPILCYSALCLSSSELNVMTLFSKHLRYAPSSISPASSVNVISLFLSVLSWPSCEENRTKNLMLLEVKLDLDRNTQARVPVARDSVV